LEPRLKHAPESNLAFVSDMAPRVGVQRHFTGDGVFTSGPSDVEARAEAATDGPRPGSTTTAGCTPSLLQYLLRLLLPAVTSPVTMDESLVSPSEDLLHLSYRPAHLVASLGRLTRRFHSALRDVHAGFASAEGERVLLVLREEAAAAHGRPGRRRPASRARMPPTASAARLRRLSHLFRPAQELVRTGLSPVHVLLYAALVRAGGVVEALRLGWGPIAPPEEPGAARVRAVEAGVEAVVEAAVARGIAPRGASASAGAGADGRAVGAAAVSAAARWSERALGLASTPPPPAGGKPPRALTPVVLARLLQVATKYKHSWPTPARRLLEAATAATTPQSHTGGDAAPAAGVPLHTAWGELAEAFTADALVMRVQELLEIDVPGMRIPASYQPGFHSNLDGVMAALRALEPATENEERAMAAVKKVFEKVQGTTWSSGKPENCRV
jgi:hypothetical protein